MKTILLVLGALFLVNRSRGAGLSLTVSANASPIPTTGNAGSPFGTTPAGGGAGTIILPQNDPYSNTYNAGAGGGGAGVPLDPSTLAGADTSLGFHSLNNPARGFPAPRIDSRVSPGRFRLAN